MNRILLGVDRIQQFRDLFRGRVALLTSPTGRTGDNRSTVEALAECCRLTLLLAPEHGVRGDKAAGEQFHNEVDPESGLPVMSLYRGTSKRLSSEAISLFDTLVYDIADVGCRYYTFISSLKNCMEDCAGAGKTLVVLDRPNPLGDRVEGGCLRREYISFVGCHTIPVCYGLTCGEIAGMMNEELGIGCRLQVIPCKGLERRMTFRDLGMPWIMPSPNIPRYETALLYPGTCLLEGTNCSEGRGTADPFAIVGAPYIRAEQLSEKFNDLRLEGVMATPVSFTPSASKHQGQICGGIHLHILDENRLRPTEVGVRLLKLLQQLYPEDFRILPPPAETGRSFLSLLAGHEKFEDPRWDPDALLKEYERDSEEFRLRKKRYEIY